MGGYYRCSAYPIIEGGIVQRIVVAVDDLTERRRVDSEMRLQTEYLAVLHETALGLIARRELPSLLTTIVERAAALLGAPHGFLYLLEPGACEMELQVGLGIYAAHRGRRLHRGQGLAGRVWRTGRSLVAAVSEGDDPTRDTPGESVRRSRVAVPLLAQGQVVGVLGVAAELEKGGFHFDEIALLSRFAELASIAVDNARLYEAAQRELAERRQVEESLRRSEARYRTLFESAGDAILIYDMNGRLLAANRLACDRLGYNLGELLQMAPADLESPPYAGWFQDRMEELRRHGHHFFETVHLRSDGTPIPTELSSRLIEYDGELAVLAIARDVTERRQMEQRLLHTERLAAMGQLAAALAHEINNPLQSIGSSIELVLDYPLSPTEHVECVTLMSRAKE